MIECEFIFFLKTQRSGISGCHVWLQCSLSVKDVQSHLFLSENSSPLHETRCPGVLIRRGKFEFLQFYTSSYRFLLFIRRSVIAFHPFILFRDVGKTAVSSIMSLYTAWEDAALLTELYWSLVPDNTCRASFSCTSPKQIAQKELLKMSKITSWNFL
jgi:hypothetical protein